MPVLAVIPARLASTRLPQKPLQLLGGAPLIRRVTERVLGFGLADRIVVATDADAVAAAVAGLGVEVALTAPELASGTDRVAAVARQAGFAGFDVIVNVQGDEPFLPREAFAGAVARVMAGDDIGTAAVPLATAEAATPSVVKVVMDRGGRALYFSRSVIPHWRGAGAAPTGTYWQHLGIYAFRRAALTAWQGLRPTPLEQAEGLEQLRALEQGLVIGVARLDTPALPGIDTPADLARAEAHWHSTHEASR